MSVLGQLVPWGLIFTKVILLLANLAASHCPPSTSVKCSLPHNNPKGIEFLLSPAFMKPIKLKLSHAYRLGGVILPVSMQKLCNLQRQQTIALSINSENGYLCTKWHLQDAPLVDQNSKSALNINPSL